MDQKMIKFIEGCQQHIRRQIQWVLFPKSCSCIFFKIHFKTSTCELIRIIHNIDLKEWRAQTVFLQILVLFTLFRKFQQSTLFTVRHLKNKTQPQKKHSLNSNVVECDTQKQIMSISDILQVYENKPSDNTNKCKFFCAILCHWPRPNCFSIFPMKLMYLKYSLLAGGMNHSTSLSNCFESASATSTILHNICFKFKWNINRTSFLYYQL